MTKKGTITLENRGSLLTHRQGGCDWTLGYLMSFAERGIYDASIGKVDVTQEEADTHNQLLDTALIEGLDERCEVGQCGTFYLQKNESGRMEVRTWLGTIVSEKVQLHGEVVTFYRGGKKYRGRTQKDSDCFNFRRIE